MGKSILDNLMTSSFLPAHNTELQIVRVLLVDDRPQVRHDLRQLLLLTEAIDVVGEATNGEEAVRLTAELRPDAVLMDLEMPGMDGYEATRRIKNESSTIRVIILSIHAGPEERRRARAAGADCFVVKGESYEVLVDAIHGAGRASNGLNHRKGKQT